MGVGPHSPVNTTSNDQHMRSTAQLTLQSTRDDSGEPVVAPAGPLSVADRGQRPLRIVFFNRSYYPDYGATGQLLTELCEDLVARANVDLVGGCLSPH